MVVDDLISQGYPLVRRIALEFSDKLAPGTTIDDLISLGGEEIIRAHNTFDPENGKTWQSFLAKWLRFEYRSFLSVAHKRAKRQKPLECENSEGERLQRVDERAVDPSEKAGDNEARASDRSKIKRLRATVPSPDRVAAKARRLMEETFDAVRDGEMGEVLRAVMKRAKTGDLAAVKLLWEMFGIRFTPHHSSEGY